MEYPFIAIAPRSILTRSGSIWLQVSKQIRTNSFKNQITDKQIAYISDISI